MSILTQITNLFTTPIPNVPLGIALRTSSIAYFTPSIEDNNSNIIAHNAATFALTLNELVKSNALAGQCMLVLPNSATQIVQVERPNVPVEELLAALKWQIKDLVSISPDDMVLDYFDGPKPLGGIEKLNVVCTHKTDLIPLIETLTTDQTNVKAVTTEEFAFASLLPVQQDAILMVCQQPSEEINLLIIKNGQLFFSRRLRGFAQISGKDEQALAMEVVDALSLEIQRSTDYFERQLKQAPIKRIEILIPMDNEAFLARKLAENTNVEVSLFEMPQGTENKRESAVAIGATQLNFMEPENNG